MHFMLHVEIAPIAYERSELLSAVALNSAIVADNP
jgi:hypothetical protein